MDKVVQKNASGAEESASAAEEMNAQAERMKEFVRELFALAGGGRNGNGIISAGALHPLGKGGDHVLAIDRQPKTLELHVAETKKNKEMKQVKPDQVIPWMRVTSGSSKPGMTRSSYLLVSERK